MSEKLDQGNCPNCGAKIQGQFCFSCGQNHKGIDRYFWSLINEAFEGVFSFNSRAWKTTLYLWFKPGKLTQEYFANRRARYVSSLRLYLITSIVFFLVLSIQTNFFSNVNVAVNNDVDQQLATEQEVKPKDMPSREDLEARLDTKISIPFLGEEKEKELGEAFDKKIVEAFELGKERPNILIDKILDISPAAVFILLPVFALLVKLLYLRKKLFYTQHLVFVVHNQSFVFANLTLITLVGMLAGEASSSWLFAALMLWMFLYMPLSLKRVYAQSWLMTICKTLLLYFAYAVLFLFTWIMVVLFGVIFL
ncbi:MAG: DUF3667 domain-containing protein [Gammaproteobacteria bacterium]|nr:DUF3667 domain-containing protein [Gammaproteobacteria bacterium]